MSTLCNIISKYGGLIQTGPFGSQLHEYEYVDVGVPVVMPKDIVGGKINYGTIARVSEEKASQLHRHKLQASDIVFPRRGDIGKCAFVSKNDAGCLCGTGSLKITVPDAVLSPRFLFYFLGLPESVKWLENNSTGSTMMNLNTDILGRIEIPDLPIEQQRRIADILSAYDDLIENNRRRIAILEETARLTYRKWFGVVEEGRTTTLGDVLEVLESGSRPRGGAVNDGVPSIGAEKIESIGIYDYSSEKYVSREYYDKMRRGKIRSGDVLLYKDGAYTGKVSMALNGFPHVEAAVNEHVFILRTRNLHAQCFLYCFLRQQEIYERINTIASAKACQPGLNQSDVLNLEIELPTDDEIGLFENRVIPLFDEILNFAKQNAALVTARDMLLPRLMKGQSCFSSL